MFCKVLAIRRQSYEKELESPNVYVKKNGTAVRPSQS